jgi:flagellar biosynthesis protein FliR
MLQEIPWMPSLARVMPAISVFMVSLPLNYYLPAVQSLA